MDSAASSMIVAILLGLVVLIFFLAIRVIAGGRDPVEERLAEYGLTDYVLNGNRRRKTSETDDRFSGLNRWLRGRQIGAKLSMELIRADVPITPGEFVMILAGLVAIGVAIGLLRGNIWVSIGLGAVLAAAPFFYLRVRRKRRRNAFIAQLPDVLTLLVGSLRAGYGLSQAIELVATEVPPPTAKEFQRVIRAMSLGLPLQTALEAMAERIQSDDLDLVVTAISIQYEMGGNLSSVLETITDTIRQRVRILREVQVLTAQQRMTGNILAALPIVLAIGFSIISPGFFDPFFEPGWVRLLPLAAGVMIVIGFVIIRKIVDIKV